MNTKVSFTAIAPPIFYGSNYQGWAARMEAYFEAIDVWEAVEQKYEVPPLPNNRMVAQMSNLKFYILENNDLENNQRDLGFLKAREYSDRLLGIVNNVRLLGTNLSDSRIGEKTLVIIFERFETIISSLENMKVPSTITLAKLLNAL
ncbi:4-coumarate--CoA ligase 2-like [Gossypium australe]|uniref:4-coumarate--CoA ligase 2-like n=1 Tax=Gossypium australe TaxID=47621 RepID=A0A5B6VX38_9ROSI|nr:4-coumarate--CoA ligase 2-like [Gossypium australe]